MKLTYPMMHQAIKNNDLFTEKDNGLHQILHLLLLCLKDKRSVTHDAHSTKLVNFNIRCRYYIGQKYFILAPEHTD